MLVNLNQVLQPAMKQKYGVGLFNTINLEMAKGVIAAAQNKKAPIIIGTAEVLLPYASLQELSYFLIPMAQKADIPIFVHLDRIASCRERVCQYVFNSVFPSHC